MEDWLTERSFVKSPEEILAKDFKRANNYWDWDKIDKLKALNIMMLSERGTGKTFGCIAWALMKGFNVAFLVNSGQNAVNQLDKMLKKLQGKGDSKERQKKYTKEDKEIHKFFEHWVMDGGYLNDPTGTPRVVATGINTYYSTKGIRDFMPDIIIYDEFNQQSKLVEQKETKAKDKLDFITGTLRDNEFEPRHVFFFANTNSPDGPIQSASILTDLGITSLTYLNQYTEVYNTVDMTPFKKLKGTPDYEYLKNQKILNTILIKPEYTDEEALHKIVELVKNRQEHKFDVDLILTGNYQATMFNKDTFNFDDYILSTFRLMTKSEQQSNFKHYGYLQCKNGDVLDILMWTNHKTGYGRLFKYHIKRISDLPESATIFAYKKPYKESNRLLSPTDKNNLLEAFTHGWASYEDTNARVDFAREIL